jgi:hypothetical protein
MRVEGVARDITPFVRRFRWTESLIAGGWSWSMSLSTEQWPEWNELLVGRERPTVHFRLKNQEELNEFSTEWKRAYVEDSRAAFRGASMLAQVRGGDKRLEMRQRARTRTFREATTADVCRRIAGEYDLVPNMDDTTARRDRYQLREDDWGFMRRLLAESALGSGRGDVFLWLDEATLRLHAPEMAALSARRHDLAEVENRVDRVTVGYHGRRVDRLGGASQRVVGFDLSRKDALVFDLDAGQAQALPSLAKRVPRDPDDGLRVYALAEEGSPFVEEAARARWGRVAPRYFSLRLDTRPDLALRPGSVIEVQANLDLRRESPFFGRFVVLEVQHSVERSAIRSTAICYRREAFEGEVEPTGASVTAGGTRDRYRVGQPERSRTIVRAEVIGG